MPDRSSAQSREPDHREPAEHAEASPAPAARERPLWGRILRGLRAMLLLLAIREHPSTPAELSNPGPGQSRQPDGTVPADEGQMPDGSRADSREPDSTVPAEEAETASPDVHILAHALAKALADEERKSPWRRRILLPLSLGAFIVVPLLLAIRIYPKPLASLDNLGPLKLTITTTATVTQVEYVVSNSHMEVFVYAKPTGPKRASPSEAVIQIAPGWVDPTWPTTLMTGLPATAPAPFAPSPPPLPWDKSPGPFVASANFDMGPDERGLAYNGRNASAEIPEVVIPGPRENPGLHVSYDIPSGSSYDWSPGPPQTAAEWSSHLTRADTPGQMFFGTDHGREDSDNLHIFVAGALIALAGAAVLAALQEALSRFVG